jgi:hypothetical protein
VVVKGCDCVRACVFVAKRGCHQTGKHMPAYVKGNVLAW